MSLARLKETFFRLPKHIKLIGIGSLVLAISPLLPWYADLDSYKIGDEFLGVTGPASFVGIVIVILAVLSFWIFSYHLLERHSPRLPVREAIVHLAVSLESLFLTLVVISIYFHPKFGVNITLKESRFGMAIAFIGAIILFVGAYLQNKAEIAKEKDTGKLEPLITIKEPPASYQRPHAPLEKPPMSEPRKTFPHAHTAAKGFVFGEKKIPEQKESKPTPHQEEKEDSSGSYMIRMDL